MKLTENQKQAILKLRQYPNAIIMHNGWLTGGHGVHFDKRTINSLKTKKIIVDNQLSELGKTIEL